MSQQKRSLRYLERRIQDESGATWDRAGGWITRDEVRSFLDTASRVLVHDQGARQVRELRPGELPSLLAGISDSGASGRVLAADYVRGNRHLIVLSITC